MNKTILITGGAGFIGSNLANYFSRKGYRITILDNFQRYGTKENAAWLKDLHPNLSVIEADIRDFKSVKKAVKKKDAVFHMAAQVAVTTSVYEPRNDFEVNALGTFNVLEALRQVNKDAHLIFASTNKVYGGMEEIKVIEKETEYAYKDFPKGISERHNLDFHSPYGCSKGAADQYVRDYFRIYQIPTTVFRQSCIFGPRQFGIEDQGWVAWFIIASTYKRPITVYGDGKQVRDLLYVDDLVKLFETAIKRKDTSQGKIYNVGGGKDNTLSVWSQFGPILEKLFERKIKVKFSDWRPGDQKVYVSDISFVKKDLKWSPEIGVEKGIKKLFFWVQKNKAIFKRLFK